MRCFLLVLVLVLAPVLAAWLVLCVLAFTSAFTPFMFLDPPLHSARMILSDVLNCTVPPLRFESSLIKHNMNLSLYLVLLFLRL
jgi:hypothetical protein